MASTQTGGTNRVFLILGAVAALAVLVIGYQAVSQATRGAVTAPVTVDGLDDPVKLLELAQGMVLGDPAAPVTIYEFGDYQCPGCGQFALQTKPLIETAYVNDGRAKFVFYDFPLTNIHPNAFLAARASRCAADQDGYWDYHRKLFEEQARWSTQSAPVGTFTGYATEMGLDGPSFEDCLNSDRHAEVVTAQMHLGVQLNVPVTPTVMVSQGDGQATMLSDRSFPSIQATVDSLLNRANTDSP